MSTKVLDGKVAVVTGANGDQGREVVTAYLASGATVIAVDLAFPDDYVNIVSGSSQLVQVVGDIGSADSTQVVRQAVEPFGKCDVLYNNAALFLPGRGDGTASVVDMDAWNRVISVNVTGTMHMIRAVLPTMVEQGSGSIINVASIAAVIGSYNVAYATSKGAILALTKSMAVTHGPLGIRTIALSLGPIDTQMMSQMKSDPQAWEKFINTVPLRRAGTAREIANWAVFLASDGASFANGANIIVDGGRVLNVG